MNYWDGDISPIPNIETYTKLALRSSRVLDSGHFDLMEPKLQVHYMEREVRGIVLEMQAYVWSKELETRTVPHGWAGWWDHLRADHFPRWANRRWPPHRGSVTVNARAVYPELSNQLRPKPILQIVSLDLHD